MKENYGMTEETHVPDNLFAGSGPKVARGITLLSGENRARGALLGKITKAAAAVVPAEGNAGDGTCTGVVLGLLAKIGNYVLKCIGTVAGAITTPVTGTADGGNAGANTMTGVSAGAAVKAGTYTAECVDATTGGSEIYQVTDPDWFLLAPATVAVAYVNPQINFTLNDIGANAQVGDKFTILASAADGDSGQFSVTSPTGEALPPATVGVAYVNPQINFVLNDGAADFEVDDVITIPVVAGSLKYKLSAAAAVDGSQVPCAILAKATDASLGDIETVVYETGEFVESGLVLGVGHTIASVREGLKAMGIHLKAAVA